MNRDKGSQPFVPFGRLPDNLDASSVAQKYLDKLASLQHEDLHDRASWRDILAFTNTFRTFNGAECVLATWQQLSRKRQTSKFELIPNSAQALQLGPVALLTARFKFKTEAELVADSTGTIILLPEAEGNEWKVWILNTLLGIPATLGNPDELAKVSSAEMNVTVIKNNDPTSGQDETVDVVVVGAGQSGLCMLGRLKALGLKAVALEQNARVGDNWTNRYASAKLHLNKWYASMPFGNTFYDEKYPYFLTAADLSEGFRQFVADYGLDVRTSTKVNSATWDSEGRMWMVTASQKNGSYAILGRHLIFAIGTDQIPNFPQYPGRELFNGTVVHSVDYQSPTPWKAMKGVIVGTANTAHDVAEDMLEAELSSVTMVQRSPTVVLAWPFFAHVHDKDYNGNANLYESDQNTWALPTLWYDTIPPLAFNGYMQQHPKMFQALEQKGFKVKRPQSFTKDIRERSGGHYLDVGCCQKIIDGRVTMKDGEIESYTPTGLKFVDGTTLDADVIVWATGFRSNIRETIVKIVGPEIGAQLEDYPRWDSEGEVPGFFRRQEHPAIWYAPGELAMARMYSRFLALTIKADIVDIPFEPYMDTP